MARVKSYNQGAADERQAFRSYFRRLKRKFSEDPLLAEIMAWANHRTARAERAAGGIGRKASGKPVPPPAPPKY